MFERSERQKPRGWGAEIFRQENYRNPKLNAIIHFDMTDDEIRKLVDGDPINLIKVAEEMGIDFGVLDKDIAKQMVRLRFSITDNQFEAVDFIFWIAYLIEREAEELIIYPEVHIGARKDAMETIVGKLHFGDKINIIEKLYLEKKNGLIKLMRKIQDLRNDIAHGRFDKLEYCGYDLSDNKGKIMLVANLRDLLLKKKNESN